MATEDHQRSRRQEAEVAADNQGKRNPGSGNGWRFKNDVRSGEPGSVFQSGDYSFECKTTKKNSASLKRPELDAAEKQALADGKDMVWVNDINGRRYYTVCDYTWHTLRDD